MRTTLALDDDVARLAKAYAENRRLSLGKAVSELIRRGLTLERRTRKVNGLEIFDLPPESPIVTTEKVKRLESETR